jgi:magnesium chelatase subunit H
MSNRRKVVAIVGLEQYNAGLWKKIKGLLSTEADLTQLSDVDLDKKNPEAAAAIQEADCVFMSMINFKEQIDWFKLQLDQSTNDKTVFVFESMPEAMALTKVGGYSVGDGKAGMPDIVKKVAKMLVKGRDEDALYGYMKLMKIMRTILPLVPNKAKDFKNWLLVYSYWMQPTAENIANMFRLILREYFNEILTVGAIVDVPNMGLYHPDAPPYFSYKAWMKKRGINIDKGEAVGLLFFRKHLLQEKTYIDNTIRVFEKRGIHLYPAFVMGVEGHVLVRDWLVKENIGLLVNMMGFGLVGGPAGSTKPGTAAEARHEIMTKLDVPYIVAQPLLTQGFESWHELGVSPMQITFTYAIPEMDGAICPIILGALQDGKIETVPERIERLAGLVSQWLRLRTTANRDKKVALIVYDYPPGLGKKASAALLDVPRTLLATLQRLKKEGYTVGQLPETSDALFHALDRATDHQIQQNQPDALKVSYETFKGLTSSRERERIEDRWQKFPGEIVPMGEQDVFVGGIKYGNIFIGVQPRIGMQGDPMRLLFDKENTPHHQYIAFYRWISREFQAHAMVHVGMHGSVEWMPGLQTGLTGDCWPDALLGEVPHFYIYPVNNPSESTIAKRRGLATMVSHVVPPLSRAGLYKELPALKELLVDVRERNLAGNFDGKGDGTGIEEAVMQKAELLNLTDDCPRPENEEFIDYVSRLYIYISELENRLISNSLHVFGEASPLESQIITITETLKNREDAGKTLPYILMTSSGKNGHYNSYEELTAMSRKGDEESIRLREWVENACRDFVQQVFFDRKNVASVFSSITGGTKLPVAYMPFVDQLTQDGAKILYALRDNTGEMDSLMKVLNGRYISSGPGGDLVRDGINVLPSGRNIHSIDPWRIPSEMAFKRGTLIADSIVKKHLEENDGKYPETIAQVLWGLDTIKTKGEAVAVVIRLLGGEPAYDAFGKISHYALVPLDRLGRPRIDVLMQLSPIFRDAFGLLMDQLDRLIKAAAVADEPADMNYIKKHVDEALASGVEFESATARQFTQSPGAYGTYVDDMIEDSAWDSENDLDDLFIRRNSSAYGGGRKGEKESEILQKLLGSVDRVVHQVDSTEFGISDIDHYFSTSGSLQLAARRRNTKGGDIKLNYVESFTSDIKVDDAEKSLRIEYRSKLLNPKWFEGMLKHGHSGAGEISNRVTYMLGWDAVTKSVDDWVYKKTAETYALDPEMRERLATLNPQAIKNIVGRMLEAHGRGMWKADQDMINELQEIYADLEDRLEGLTDTE